MKNKFFKISLFAIAMSFVHFAFAQTRPTLEWTKDGSNRTSVGPSTSSITVNFLRDLLNPAIPTNAPTFTYDATPLIATVSFRNQQYSTTLTGSSTVVPGMSFGGRNTSSNNTDADAPSNPGVQAIGATQLYNVFAADIPASKPLNNMFITSPSAPAVSKTSTTSGGSGTTGGFDTQSITGAQGPAAVFIPGVGMAGDEDANFGIAMYTAAEPLADILANPTGRFYYGDVVINFNRTVKDPVIHIGGLGGSYSYTSIGGTVFNAFFTTELELANSANSAASSLLAGNLNIDVANNKITNLNTNPNAGSIIGDATYGAASGSIKVTGSYSQLVYRIFLKGTPGNFGWSQTANNITSATRDPFNGDLWYLAVSLDRPNQQISGNVFYDTDQLLGDVWRDASTGLTYARTDGSQNGTTLTSVTPGIFHANLLGPTGNVIATTPIGRDGSYLFDNVPVGTYTVSLSSVPGTIGSPFPTGAFPPGWINTGQQIGLISGNDGTNDGRSAIITINAGDIQTNVNFGVFNPLALPASLLSFNGALNGSIAKLVWVATNEVNFSAYELQRSTNGVNYTTISTTAPRATGNQNTYTYDDNIAGLGNKVYYKLKMIDKDGSFKYSNVVIVRVGSVKLSNVYPNPFVQSVRIELESRTKENAQIRIIAANGKVVVSQQEQIQIGGNQITINGLDKLSTGTYTIEITTSTERIIEKLTKN